MKRVIIFPILVSFLFVINVSAEASEYKSLATARLYSALLPGAGQFYVHNYWEGVLDFVVTGGLVAGTILSFNAMGSASEEAGEGEMSKEDWRMLGWTFGVCGLGYYIFQIWKLNDDVVVYNYKKRFIESTSLNLNFTPTKYTLLLEKNF